MKTVLIDELIDSLSGQTVVIPKGTVIERHYDHGKGDHVTRRLESDHEVQLVVDQDALRDLAIRALRHKSRGATSGPIMFKQAR